MYLLLDMQLLTPPQYPFIDLSIILLTLLLIWLLALFLLFWLGSATGHRSHTPTTTPFQYPATAAALAMRASARPMIASIPLSASIFDELLFEVWVWNRRKVKF